LLTSVTMSLLSTLAHKFGLGDRQDILSSAHEFLRQLESSSKVRAMQQHGFTATATAVVAINLAAEKAEKRIDSKTLVKIAGVKKANYVGFYRAVEKELGLENVPTVEEMAVRLGCSQIRQNAVDVLKVYKTHFLSGLPESRYDFGFRVLHSVGRHF
jgi:hypothetical protein